MPEPVPVIKYVAGYVHDADQLPVVNEKVTATLSNRIVDVGDNDIIENDETVSTVTDGTGRWVLPLRPNNVIGDTPQNTFWTITEPSGESFLIQIPYNHAAGGTDPGAIPYTTLLSLPADLDPLVGGATLTNRIAALETIVVLMNTLDEVGLGALTPPQSTALVDAAESVSTDATAVAPGRMTSAHFNIVKTFEAAGTNDPVYLARLHSAGGIKVPKADDPTFSSLDGTARLYVSNTDGGAKIQQGTSAGRTTVAPGLVSPSWQATADVPITATTYVTVASFAVLAAGRYEIRGPIFYTADAAVDLTCRFASIPGGSTLRWGYTGITAANTNTGVDLGRGSLDANSALGNAGLTFGGAGTAAATPPVTFGLPLLMAVIEGVLTVGPTVTAPVTFQAQKGTTGVSAAILAASSLFFVRQA